MDQLALRAAGLHDHKAAARFEDPAYFTEKNLPVRIFIGQITEGKGNPGAIQAAIRKGKLPDITLHPDQNMFILQPARFFDSRFQHRPAEIKSDNLGLPIRRFRQVYRQIPGSAAEIQYGLRMMLQAAADSFLAPGTVQPPGNDPVDQIIPPGDSIEHFLEGPCFGFFHFSESLILLYSSKK